MVEATTASAAASLATGTTTTSLNAYAAWLAKHETKVARKQNPAEVEASTSAEETVVETVVESVVERVVQNDAGSIEAPYLQWLQRKETKLPLVKVVVASPDRVENAPTVEANASICNDDAESHEKRDEMREKTPTIATNAMAEVALNRGKKRLAGEDPTDCAHLSAGKKMKRTSSVAPRSASPLEPSFSEAAATYRRSGSTPINPSVKLPMLEEVRYWQNVDRFSFLS